MMIKEPGIWVIAKKVYILAYTVVNNRELTIFNSSFQL